MPKFLTILLIIFCFFACKKEEPKLLNADSVELTFDNGWTGGVSMKIDNNGIVHYIHYDIHGATNTKTCYTDTLNNQTIDSVNSYLSKLKNEKIDSLYDGHCQDCGAFLFLITFHDRKIESTVIGRNAFSNDLSCFGRFLLKNQLTDYNRIDTCTDFQTTKFLKPPPPPKPIDIQEFTSTKKVK
jgi:hypothetical protein